MELPTATMEMGIENDISKMERNKNVTVPENSRFCCRRLEDYWTVGCFCL